jgi:GAF domain-containing protein
VQPLPETTEALAALALATDDPEAALTEEFDEAAATTRRIAPECVGVTLTFVQDGLSFTWVASDLGSEALDAGHDPVARPPAGVRSTLSIPLMAGDRVYGGLNLYGRTPGAFDGHHEELAALYGGWAGGAVMNADLSFASMARARNAPRALAEADSSNLAVGMIMAAHDVPEADARDTLSDAAARAGVTAGQAADILLETRAL